MAEIKHIDKLQIVERGTANEPLKTRIKQRQSKYIVLAFCGPVGSNIPGVVGEVKTVLQNNYGYDVQIIKVSDLIKTYTENLKIESYDSLKLDEKGARYMVLQNAGNELRKLYGADILGQLSIKAISVKRAETILEEKGKELVEDDLKSSHRVAYLIDSLKHPEEVDILRAVYRNMFYLFGVFCAYPVRKRRLEKEDITPDIVEKIMERDKQEEEVFGQKLIKTLQYADFFIRNNHENITSVQKQLGRYFDLIFKSKIVTPTKDEHAMYMAQSSALNSGCLSRQIGAVITNTNGDIIATGFNDVPKAHGGLYCSEDQENDMRCAFMGGTCRNDSHKTKIKKHIEQIIQNMLKDHITSEKTTQDLARILANEISDGTRLKDLIEFSRAVHAEMDAIISATRTGASSLIGATLYTTTFPCHNCARHIIAAGIDTVYYIEPYEKSLAIDLHDDAIELEPPSTKERNEKVVFLHFEGVAPRQYMNLFQSHEERKEKGKMVTIEARTSLPTLAEYLDSWVDFESKVVENLQDLGLN